MHSFKGKECLVIQLKSQFLGTIMRSNKLTGHDFL